MNYGELKIEIADTLHRSDLSDQIPRFVEKARQRLNRDLRIQEMVTRTTVTPTRRLLTCLQTFWNCARLAGIILMGSGVHS